MLSIASNIFFLVELVIIAINLCEIFFSVESKFYTNVKVLSKNIFGGIFGLIASVIIINVVDQITLEMMLYQGIAFIVFKIVLKLFVKYNLLCTRYFGSYKKVSIKMQVPKADNTN